MKTTATTAKSSMTDRVAKPRRQQQGRRLQNSSSFLFGTATFAAMLLVGCCPMPSFAGGEVFRLHHLDYLDAETLRHFLTPPTKRNAAADDIRGKGEKAGYDVAVMFYAQWCRNCHALAPIWQQIAAILDAGSKKSNIVMSLFDCESDQSHAELCTELGVTHYPTLMFISTSGQKLGQITDRKSKYHHVTKFPGNWQYGDSILDWVRAMMALSQWRRRDWGHRFRRVFFGGGGGAAEAVDNALPIGIPGTGGGAGVTGAAAGDGAATAGATTSSTSSEQQLKRLEEKNAKYLDLAVRGSVIIDTLMFPVLSDEFGRGDRKTNSSGTVMSDGEYGGGANKLYTDVYALLHKTNAWTTVYSAAEVAAGTVAERNLILSSCVQEVSVDYCDRVTLKITEDWVMEEDFQSLSDISEGKYNEFINVTLPNTVKGTEPFCNFVDECHAYYSDKDAVSASSQEERERYDEICRPPRCPFADRAGCRYLTSCLTESIQEQYATALSIGAKTGDEASSKTTASASTSAGGGGGGWGMA